MLYLVLKALHVVAVMAWMAGMIVMPFILASRPGPSVLATARSSLSRLTTAAMLLALALGIWLAGDAGWFREAWLQLKLALVLALTALHGVVAGQARRFAADPERRAPRLLVAVPWATLACIAGVAFLAIVKPRLWS